MANNVEWHSVVDCHYWVGLFTCFFWRARILNHRIKCQSVFRLLVVLRGISVTSSVRIPWNVAWASALSQRSIIGTPLPSNSVKCLINCMSIEYRDRVHEISFRRQMFYTEWQMKFPKSLPNDVVLRTWMAHRKNNDSELNSSSFASPILQRSGRTAGVHPHVVTLSLRPFRTTNLSVDSFMASHSPRRSNTDKQKFTLSECAA